MVVGILSPKVISVYHLFYASIYRHESTSHLTTLAFSHFKFCKDMALGCILDCGRGSTRGGWRLVISALSNDDVIIQAAIAVIDDTQLDRLCRALNETQSPNGCTTRWMPDGIAEHLSGFLGISTAQILHIQRMP